MGEGDDPTCRLCGNGPEEPVHLFLHCEALSWDRTKLAQEDLDWKVEDLDDFLLLPSVRELLG